MPRRPISEEEIVLKLGFAKRRMTDLLNLNEDDFPGNPGLERHLLAQEFFFHLLGAIELTAQFVNEVCALGLKLDKVSTGLVLKRLGPQHTVRTAFAALHANPRRDPMPSDPYAPKGMVYRAYNYRHQVTHRRANPFLYRFGSTPPASFILDPRCMSGVPSERSIQEEMSQMLQLVTEGCRRVLTLARQL